MKNFKYTYKNRRFLKLFVITVMLIICPNYGTVNITKTIDLKKPFTEYNYKKTGGTQR